MEEHYFPYGLWVLVVALCFSRTDLFKRCYMMMKNLYFLLVVYLVCASFVACSDDPNAYLDYVNGKINGEYFSIDNSEQIDEVIRAIFVRHFDLETPIALDTLTGIDINVPAPISKVIYVQLSHLKTGTFFPEKTDSSMANIYETLVGRLAPLEISYAQNDNNPVRIDVTRVEYREEWLDVPVIEGNINGIFYNKTNPKDSIVLEDVAFGVH
jgi:hypothetical protein